MLDTKTAALENGRTRSSYRARYKQLLGFAPEEHY